MFAKDMVAASCMPHILCLLKLSKYYITFDLIWYAHEIKKNGESPNVCILLKYT
jgi:hypothetical protein